jgi:hypothetical protein
MVLPVFVAVLDDGCRVRQPGGIDRIASAQVAWRLCSSVVFDIRTSALHLSLPTPDNSPEIIRIVCPFQCTRKRVSGNDTHALSVSTSRKFTRRT